MLILLSPSKTLEMRHRAWPVKTSVPEFLKEAGELNAILKTLSSKQLQKLMDVSVKIADLNVGRNHAFKTPFTGKNATPALFAFKGDVYTPIEVDRYSKADLAFANEHVRSLSGLYGLLRPMDLMQAYRLEMGTALKNKRGKDLYAFWGDRITEAINKAASGMKKPVIVNLASQEYFKAVNVGKLKYPLITPEFKEWKSGGYKVIGLFAKKARGMMTDYAIKERITDIRELKHFSTEGYRFDESLSDAASWVFTRKA